MTDFANFITVVRCQVHEKVCTMVCQSKQCESRVLCQDCLLLHNKQHLASIISISDFDLNTMNVPNLLARELNSLQTRMYSLQNQIASQKEFKKSEVFKLKAKVVAEITHKLDMFIRDCLCQIDVHFEKHQKEIQDTLVITMDHLQALDPFRKAASLHKSDKISFLLNYQVCCV